MVDPGAAAAVARGFDHVLVDEYQDVNRLQVEIVAGFAAGGCAVTAVGDDFQAIYGFRSASARFILDFPDQFADARTITLHRNYRATQPLLDVANAVSAQDTAGFPKRLVAQRDGGDPPALVYVRDQAQEAVVISDKVLAAREQGMLLREQAVLARTGHDTDLLELELSRRGIPYRKYGGLRYLDAAHVKDLLASFRLVERPGDQLAWFRILQLIDGVGPGRARRACDLLLAGDPPSLAELPARWITAREELPLSARDQADALVAAVAAGGEAVAPGVAAERLRDAIAPLVRAHYIDGATRVIDLDVLCDLAARAPDLHTFVAELVLDPPSSSGDLAGPPHLDDDWLVLSTIHSAKGLEWQSVHLIAAYDGNFPACMSAGSSRGDRRGATPVLRRVDARASRARDLRAAALLPPPGCARRRARLRQGVALPRRCTPSRAVPSPISPTIRQAGRATAAFPRQASPRRSTACSCDGRLALLGQRLCRRH